jgi:hypothetical protein
MKFAAYMAFVCHILSCFLVPFLSLYIYIYMFNFERVHPVVFILMYLVYYISQHKNNWLQL